MRSARELRGYAVRGGEATTGWGLGGTRGSATTATGSAGGATATDPATVNRPSGSKPSRTGGNPATGTAAQDSPAGAQNLGGTGPGSPTAPGSAASGPGTALDSTAAGLVEHRAVPGAARGRALSWPAGPVRRLTHHSFADQERPTAPGLADANNNRPAAMRSMLRPDGDSGIPVIKPATQALLSRRPVAPPKGTPMPPPAAVPATPTGGTTADTTDAGAALAAMPAPPVSLAGRTGPLPPMAAGGPAASPGIEPAVLGLGGPNRGGAPASSRRASLVDQFPASLFARAAWGSSPSSPVVPPSVFASGSPGSSAVVRRSTDVSAQSPRGEQRPASVASALTPREWDELVELIVEKIEDRVHDELARRGRRFNPGVF